MIYDISYRTFIGAKPLCIRSAKIDRVTKGYDRPRYLTLLVPEKYDAIDIRIRYPLEVKCGVTFVFSHYFVKIKVDSYDSVPIEKTLTV